MTINKETKSKPKPRVLLCESDELIRKILANQVKSAANAEVFEADNGRIASKVLSLRNFDLVITSMLLPVKSGLEIIEYIRDELHKDIPIMIIAPDNQEHTMREAYQMGVDDFVHKPVNPVEFNLRAQYLIDRNSQAEA